MGHLTSYRLILSEKHHPLAIMICQRSDKSYIGSSTFHHKMGLLHFKMQIMLSFPPGVQGYILGGVA